MFGDWGQALSEFLVLAALGVGSLGLFVRPWMVDAARWGLLVPLVFLVGFILIDLRRQQRQTATGSDGGNYDWIVVLWSYGCALAGVAAFVIAWGAEPPPPPPWTPPESAVSVDISP